MGKLAFASNKMFQLKSLSLNVSIKIIIFKCFKHPLNNIKNKSKII